MCWGGTQQGPAFWCCVLILTAAAAGGHAAEGEPSSVLSVPSKFQKLLDSVIHRPAKEAVPAPPSRAGTSPAPVVPLPPLHSQRLSVGKSMAPAINHPWQSTEKAGEALPVLSSHPKQKDKRGALLRKVPLDTNPPKQLRKSKRPDFSKYYAYDPGPPGQLPPQLTVPKVSCRSPDDCPSPRHACLRGFCTCPPILRGAADCSKQTPLQPERHYCFSSILSYIQDVMDPRNLHSTFSKLRFLNIPESSNASDLPRRGNWARCAVVASGAELQESPTGREIDNHTAVFRFNDAPTEGHEVHAGSKTTVRIQNLNYCSFAEKDSEVCLTYSGMPERCPNKQYDVKCRGDNLAGISKPFFKYLHAYWTMNRPRTASNVMLDRACRWICPKKLKISPGNPKPRDQDLPAAMRLCKRRCDRKTSAGYFGILYASHLCGEVSVYGFPLLATKQSHYYSKKEMTGKSGKNPRELRHHWSFERHCLSFLAEGGIPGLKVVVTDT